MKLLKVLFLFMIFSSAVHAAVIDRVELTGNKRIPLSRVSQYLVKAGSTFDPAVLDQSIKNLHATGYFAEISIDANMMGNEFVITYIVQEMPQVVAIIYEGKGDGSISKLEQMTVFKAGESLSFQKIGYSIRNISDYYENEGYYNVEVKHRIEYLSEVSVNVVFDINQGRKARVYNIWFYGNENFTDYELKQALKTKEKDFWSIMNGSGNVIKSLLDYDRELLKEFYFDHGYIEVEIGEPEISFQEDKTKLNYLFRVKEGSKYTVSSLSINDPHKTFSESELKELIKLEIAGDFSIGTLRKDVDKLSKKYSEIGYARVNVADKIRVNEENKTVDLVYNIERGNIYHINRITIEGNDRSSDNVIRREIDLIEGDQYNSKLLDEAKANIYATGFYELIQINEHDMGDNNIDLVVSVAEKRDTGTFLFGVSYSNLDKFAINAEISKDNLFGTGLSGKLKGEISSLKQNYMLSITEPWLFDNPYSLGFDLYSLKKEYEDEYKRQTYGGAIRIGHQPIKRRLFVGYRFAHDQTNIYDIHDNNVSKYIKKQEGVHKTNSFTPTITFSKLNNNLDPTKGVKISTSGEYAGTFLGGDSHFFKWTLEGTAHIPVAYSIVAKFHAEGGQIWKLKKDDLPIEQRFSLGGMYSIRGFKQNSISPLDEDGDKYGGDKYYQFNFELWRPLVEGNIGVRAVAFFDMGQVFDEKDKFMSIAPRKTIGAGIRFYTPMGLLRLEYGYKLDKKDDEDSGMLDFSIGTAF